MATGGIITRSAHPDALWPGVKAWYGKKYGSLPREWTDIFERRSSDKYQERVAETTGFGLAAVKSEGASVAYDSDQEGVLSTFTHTVFGLGYIVTEEELEDDQYADVSNSRAGSLAFSMRTTEEVVHANILNRAFNASYVGGDGVSLINTSHPTVGGLQSNLITAADLSEASLEDGLKAIMQMRNARGLNIPVVGRKLIVSTFDAFNAERIVGSTLRPGSANNDINAMKSLGMLPDGVVVNHYLTDTDAWFIKTDVEEGLMSFWRRNARLEKDNDFDTSNAKAKSTMRFAAGWADFRALVGSAGA
jgi:hypothetical protein